MKKVIIGILVLIFIWVCYISYNTFQYKTYYGYTFMLIDNGKKYKMNTFNLAGDVYKKQYYIILAVKEIEGFKLLSADDLKKLVSIEEGNYSIRDSDSKFYDGIISFNEDNEYVSEKITIDEITINKSVEKKDIQINYKDSTLELSSSSNLLDKKLKKTKSVLMSISSGRGGKVYKMIYFGLPISELNKKFDLDLKIKIDNKDKIVYFIKEK